ncbi:phosphoesterase family-domain-containing protein [Gigaspora rosea]|uniref:Phosphoesterase family-domain-containing protein n=1 Tax=Gigaspora rosea TaxID=44941 RepID=A0A397V206_9GLOM|nr:phosphoesterase family-domain-containing protein [Gigaspora rosea]
MAKDDDKSEKSEKSGKSGKWFDRMVVVVFENTNFTEAIAEPYFKELTLRPNGVLLSDFHGVEHPSEPNYVAEISGSTFGIKDDANYNIDAKTIVDLFEAKGISWKGYMENYPGNCNLISATGDSPVTGRKNRLYARKHNPFFSFTTVTKNATRCAKVVNADEFDEDLKNDNLPQFVYYVPNQDNDGHDTNVTFAANWYKGWLEPKLKNKAFTKKTLIFTVFDEDESTPINHIYASILGDPVQKGNNNHNDTTFYNQYSVLRTAEDNWNLGNLGRNDTKVAAFTKFLKGNDGEKGDDEQ